jgi:hypothetical protein
VQILLSPSQTLRGRPKRPQLEALPTPTRSSAARATDIDDTTPLARERRLCRERQRVTVLTTLLVQARRPLTALQPLTPPPSLRTRWLLMILLHDPVVLYYSVKWGPLPLQ